jgi:hypothetical protein
MRPGTRAALVTLAALSLLLSHPTTANAEVVFNGRSDVAFIVPNACAPDDGPIAVTGFVQVVSREQNGVFYLHNTWHMTGVSANGTHYAVTRIIDVASAAAAFSYSSRERWISGGPSDNLFVTFTAQFPPGTFSLETDCRG